jgi:hypothetical protein
MTITLYTPTGYVIACLSALLLSTGCLSPSHASESPRLASTVEPGHLSGVWCSLDSQGAFTANSECLSVWLTPSGYEYSWSDALEDETEHGTLANGPGLLFQPQYETFCYFGPQAGSAGHFVAPNDCIRNYSATAVFIDGGVILHFETDSATFAQFE